MSDFTLNAPGTTNDPYTNANLIIPVGALKSDASGVRASTFTYSVFAHDATYGATIQSDITLGTANSGDDMYIGAVVRTGANAGAMIGVMFLNSTAIACTVNPSGTRSSISSSATYPGSVTRTAGDVLSCMVSISGGTATITASINGNSITFSANTTTTYTSETSLAAGASIDPQNSNGTRWTVFEGTGISSSPPGLMGAGCC